MQGKTEIDRIGIKAYSLKVLKEEGLFKEKLLILEALPSREEFFQLLKKQGFKDGQKIFVRFSHPKKSVFLPKKLLEDFDSIYNFASGNYSSGLAVIVHDYIQGKYGGTISRYGDELIMEFVESGWNSDYAVNIDTAIFTETESTWYLYKGERKVPVYEEGKGVTVKTVTQLDDETVQKLFLEIKGKLGKVTKLLISIPAAEDRADKLMQVIHKIKDKVDTVFIGYGVLSHPAILLREAGIRVERKLSNYRVLKLKY